MFRTRPCRPLSGFGGDEQGATIIEFAIVAPVLAALAMGIIDLGRGVAEKVRLQQAANRAIEMAQGNPALTDYSFIASEAAAAAGVPESQVQVTRFLECDGVPASISAGCALGQQSAYYVQVFVETRFVPSFGSQIYRTLRSDGTISLTGRAAVRVS